MDVYSTHTEPEPSRKVKKALPLSLIAVAVIMLGAASWLWPKAAEAPAPSGAQLPAVAETPEPALPASLNLAVPFTSQAPYAVWDATHQETCEEASILMAVAYARGRAGGQIPPAEADRELLAMVEWEKARGYAVDLTAQQTAEVTKGFYNYPHVRVEADVTAQSVKRELARGHAVILPVAGRRIGQPHFTPPGPLYHFLVVRGYQGGNFIANDPGIRQGEGWAYPEATLMAAVHDWTGSKERIEDGPRVMVVVEKR
jgi:hypothetical protein